MLLRPDCREPTASNLTMCFRSPERVVWDIIVGILVLYTTFVSPVDIAFEFTGAGKIAYKTGDYITLIFFIFDIVINFRTSYMTQSNDEIIDSRMIAAKYLASSMFWFDLVSTLPIAEISDISGSSNEADYMKWLKQLKIFRVLRLAKLNKFLQSDSAKTVYQITKIFLGFLIIFHWMTCIWFFIVKQSYNETKSTDSNQWLPSNIRALGSDPAFPENQLVHYFYEEMNSLQIYAFVLYSLVILALGNDIAPITILQVRTLAHAPKLPPPP